MALIKDIDEREMPLLDHLVELRNRLMYSAAAVLIGFLVCYLFAAHIYEFLVRPLAKIYADMGYTDRRMIYTGLTEAFFTYIKVAFWAGAFITFPFVATQLWLEEPRRMRIGPPKKYAAVALTVVDCPGSRSPRLTAAVTLNSGTRKSSTFTETLAWASRKRAGCFRAFSTMQVAASRRSSPATVRRARRRRRDGGIRSPGAVHAPRRALGEIAAHRASRRRRRFGQPLQVQHCLSCRHQGLP